MTMEELSGLETLSSSRRFKLGAGSLFILHMAVCRRLLMPWQTFIQAQSHEHSCIGAVSQKCRNTCTLQDATHLSNQMGRSPDRLAASDDAHLAAHPCQHLNNQSCPIHSKHNEVYGQLPACCVWPTRLLRPSSADDASCSPQGAKMATNRFF